eukprot:5728206-Pyramimonas_sp.AAC.1
MEEDELSDGMVVPAPPASRSLLVTRTPLQRSLLDDAPHGVLSRDEVMRRRVENSDGSTGRVPDSVSGQVPNQRTRFLMPRAGPEHQGRARIC